MNIKSRKWDIILISGVLLVGIIIMAIYFLTSDKGSYVSVSVDGRVVATFELDEDLDYDIEGAFGGTNHLHIEDGKASVTSASCPDHLCMNMGQIFRTNESIVCLPNKVVVMIENGGETEFDVIAK